MKDLIFKHTDLKHHYEIKELMEQTTMARQVYMNTFVVPI